MGRGEGQLWGRRWLWCLLTHPCAIQPAGCSTCSNSHWESASGKASSEVRRWDRGSSARGPQRASPGDLPGCHPCCPGALWGVPTPDALHLPPDVLQGEYMGQKVAVKNIKCDVTAQAFLAETAAMT